MRVGSCLAAKSLQHCLATAVPPGGLPCVLHMVATISKSLLHVVAVRVAQVHGGNGATFCLLHFVTFGLAMHGLQATHRSWQALLWHVNGAL
jgi:hypothetical protein